MKTEPKPHPLILASEALKRTPIPAGCVRVERNTYSYGQQGQTTLTHHDCVDVPESEAINRLNGQFVYVTWPDGVSEMFDLAVQPCRFMSAVDPSYGYLTINGKETSGSLSRLPNVFVEYYRPRLITAEERATFRPHIFATL